MAISDKTRKLLWGRSGNRCALCKHELSVEATALDDDSVVGDECHIHSKAADGPRYKTPEPFSDMDCYENLLLLCRIHHKLVDDQPNTFTADNLRSMKDIHERWVKLTLTPKIKDKETPQVTFLSRIKSGKQLMDVADTMAIILDHDEPKTEVEMERIASFLQNIQDWENIWSDLDSGEHVKAEFGLSKEISEIEALGYMIFATTQQRKMKFGNKIETWPVGVVTVVRSTNPAITILGELASIIKADGVL